jgi:hypothetical protein
LGAARLGAARLGVERLAVVLVPRRAAFFAVFRVALRATFLVERFAAFFRELLVRGPPVRRALLFLTTRFLEALFFRAPDLPRADFFFVAIRCAPRDK